MITVRRSPALQVRRCLTAITMHDRREAVDQPIPYERLTAINAVTGIINAVTGIINAATGIINAATGIINAGRGGSSAGAGRR
jgi:hypothetical protein